VSLRIAMLTYSVRPRGGVVHALEVSRALGRRGHEVELFALAREGQELFRAAGVPVTVVRHDAIDGPFDERVARMLATYRDGLAAPLAAGGYDVVHAQDCLSANAALDLRAAGVIDAVVRTVHHLDDFVSPSLIVCQERSVLEPDALLCVSEPWIAELGRRFGLRARLVHNGVDTARYRPARDAEQRARDRAGAGLRDGQRAILAVGGIEPRKGSLTLVDAFARVRALVGHLDPLLVVAGGATLFDYRDEADRFHARVAQLGVGHRVRTTGPVEDHELERLYRACDVLAFPSVKEGFGLVALEALASGLPLVASDLPAFAGFLRDGDNALLAPVGDAEALARAIASVAADDALAARLRRAGLRTAAATTWDAAARAHEAAYEASAPARQAGRL
jgi:glycosyltransferase-like protein